jgi:MOSC domain-containing protein YiiM
MDRAAPARAQAMREMTEAEAVAGKGLIGDRYASESGKRGVTLIQAEHLPVIAALSGHASVLPSLLRRNVVVSGLPLIALKDRRFRIGEVVLEGTDECDPCSNMEKALGPAGSTRCAATVACARGSSKAACSASAMRWSR